MDRKKLAAELRDLAQLLLAGAAQPSATNRRVEELLPALDELRRENRPDPPEDFIKGVMWNLSCLTGAGRAEIGNRAMDCAVAIQRDYPGIDLTETWKTISGLPGLTREHLRDVAASLDEFAVRLTPADAPSQENVSPDGPSGIYKWRHDGTETADAMQPQTWKLAKYLHERIGQFVPLDNLRGIVFDDLADDQTIATVGRKLTRWFRERNIPLKIGSSARDKSIYMRAVLRRPRSRTRRVPKKYAPGTRRPLHLLTVQSITDTTARIEQMVSIPVAPPNGAHFPSQTRPRTRRLPAHRLALVAARHPWIRAGILQSRREEIHDP